MNPEEILLDSDDSANESNSNNPGSAPHRHPASKDVAGSSVVAGATTVVAAIAEDDDGHDDSHGGDDAYNIAAQMGFSSFGPQDHETASRPSKRARHLHGGDSSSSPFIPSAPPSSHNSGGDTSKGARGRGAMRRHDVMTLPAGFASALSSLPAPSVSALRYDAQTDPDTVAEVMDEGTTPMDASATQASGRREHSIRSAIVDAVNENGDPVYWDPSFVEDPWEGLTPQKLQPLNRR